MTENGNATNPIIHRHKTAIRRQGLSVPIQCLLRDGLLGSSRTLFDYGCGRGRDLELLAEMGVPSSGWDPVFRPTAPLEQANIVNLGYVINVIENPHERSEALRRAWELCNEVLVVSALSPADRPRNGDTQAYSDGVLTSRGTFQKHYTHQELRDYLEKHIPIDAVPVAPNVFYLFRSETTRQQVLANRFRSRFSAPRRCISDTFFEQNQDILQPFLEALTSLGRLPGPEELPGYAALVERFGSPKRAFYLVRAVTGQDPWKEIAVRRKQDLLVYLALSRFGRKRPLSGLPLSTQLDIKAFVGTYNRAQSEANDLLFSIGKPECIDTACQRSDKGCLVENALIVRRDQLDSLEPILRVYEGCARAISGEVGDANVVKLHRFSSKVSYLVCDDLGTSEEPQVRIRIKVTLPRLAIDIFDYSDWQTLPKLGIRLDGSEP